MELRKSGVIFICLFALVYGENTETEKALREERSAGEVSELQKLLSDLQNEETVEKKPLPPMDAKETGMQSEGADNSKNNGVKLNLSDDDIKALKIIKAKIEEERKNREEQIVSKINSEKDKPAPEMGTFYDKPLTDDDLRQQKLSRLKQLAGVIMDNERRNVKGGDEISSDAQPAKSRTLQKFRKEVLHEIEDRLLRDVDLALRSGFTLEEIMADLEEEENRAEEQAKEAVRSKLLSLLMNTKGE